MQENLKFHKRFLQNSLIPVTWTPIWWKYENNDNILQILNGYVVNFQLILVLAKD